MWLFSSKKTVSKIKWIWQKILHFKICEKKRNYYLQKKLKYILPFDKESKEKPLNLVSTDSVIKNNNLHDSGVKISIIGA